MASQVPDFYNLVADQGLSRDFLFRVQTMSINGIDPVGINKKLILARAASFPGRTIEDKIANYGGHEFHLGGRATYSQSEGYPIEFYCEEGAEVRTLLESGSRSTFDVMDGQGGAFGINADDVITLQLLNQQFKGQMNITLHGVSIRDIGDIDYLIADGTGEIVKFPVTFAYQFYKIGGPQ
tara:strand:- start:161 stop:703 length:543 start_codon:yes stop_codon:yes gene_type:complete